MVCPPMQYCAQFWSPEDTADLEMGQRQMAKMIRDMCEERLGLFTSKEMSKMEYNRGVCIQNNKWYS